MEKKKRDFLCHCVDTHVWGGVSVLAESSYWRVISQRLEFDTMRSTKLKRRHITVLF